MSELRATHRAALAAAAVLVPTSSGLAFPAAASAEAAPPGGDSEDVDGAGGALEQQAAAYALDYDVDISEARRRLASQGALGAALARLRELAGDRFAGTWIEHEPDFRGVVRLTGPVADPEAFEDVIDNAPAPVDVRTDAPLSYTELAAEQTKVQALVDDLYAGATTSTDQRTGSVVVYVPDDSAEARRSGAAMLATLRTRTDAPVHVRYDPEGTRSHQLYGGDRIGLEQANCTSGFSMLYLPPGGGDPVEAVMTAGHCNDGGNDLVSFSYGGGVYVYQPLDEVQNPGADVAVYSGVDLLTQQPVGAEPEFYGVSQSPLDRTTVTGAIPRVDQTIGTVVCHQGGATDHSCGEIVATDSTDCDTSLTGGSCDPVWVRVEGESLACFAGDSGGPWFVNGTAYGINHGGNASGTDPGDCNFAVYSAIDAKSQVNSIIMLG